LLFVVLADGSSLGAARTGGSTPFSRVDSPSGGDL
jgi:hypothetical protein